MSLTTAIEESMTTATNITRVQDDYAQQIAGDLSANQTAQEQTRTELQRLQHELGQLQESEKVLLKMQEALGIPTQPTPTQTTKPTTNPGVKTTAKPTAKGTKPGTQTSAKPTTKPDTNDTAKPGTNDSAKAGVNANAKPTAKPDANTGAESGVKPAAKPGANTGTKAGVKAGVKRAAVPAARTATRNAKKATTPDKVAAPQKTAAPDKATTPEKTAAPGKPATPDNVAAPEKAAEAKDTTQITQTPAAKTPRARKTSENTETKKETGPSWLDLVTAAIAGQTEPKSAAEVTDTLTTTHPDRKVQTTVIRNTLEQGVARGILERTKQGRSVYYTPTTPNTNPNTNHHQPQHP
ncbi:hypothetical protein ACFYYS_19330 [Streptomyces sp. NPDC002120]|uniref:hypothetical protein n=1 Tax=Streptomyces sp. NPDC002120 TaxID=3364631 RepID=UPI0036B0161F